MPKDEKSTPATVHPAKVVQEARWSLKIGLLRMSARWRTTPLGNLSLGFGAAMVFAGISLLVRTVSQARRARR